MRERTRQATERLGADPVLHELVTRHEHQHSETMLQTINLARLERRAARAPRRRPRSPHRTGHGRGGGRGFELGSPGGFSYDNERPRQAVEVPAFHIGRTPITNASFLRFVEGGGYERRELWSEEAWRWKEEYDITHPLNWTGDGREWRLAAPAAGPRQARRARVLVRGRRLCRRARGAPAHRDRVGEGGDLGPGHRRHPPLPVGRPCPRPEHANLDQLALGTVAAGAHPAGASASGCLGMLGDVWEWTASDFDGYPGFEAHPYREYSEVFFGEGHKVLRGGSWATTTRVATPTFRNWDLPQRRQIFAGLRIARDA